ncbi:uncharacterized protein LOC128214995 [Mya arenaria]|uniref:uncharacterized protein LOC128214995 n=1 Tax=Mya arenaria TaxID=6604 RepID=UPI0022E20F37|nr:uncharacterized protein LOC128214995 [Mya arenaria]XP_052777691.1 uncharacterized protein LOC128214995 [Mya arenaria]
MGDLIGSDGDGAPLLLISMAVGAHLVIMVIVMYYACCRNGCSCKVTIENDNLASRERDNSDAAVLVDSDNPNTPSVPTGPVSNWWQTSLLTRVQAQFERLRSPSPYERLTGDDVLSRPPSYHESLVSPAESGHDNAGAEIDHPPSYQVFVNRLPSWRLNHNTGRYEEEKPPSYDEVV